MAPVCILTDGTVQFPANFVQRELVRVVPFHVRLNGGPALEAEHIPITALPLSWVKKNDLGIVPPSVEAYRQAFVELGQNCDEIVALLTSSQLSASFVHAQEAARSARTAAAIHLVDTQNLSVGLGLLAAEACDMAVRGLSGCEISRQVRGLIPHLFSLFCIQGLTYLSQGNHLEPAQAIAGEMMGIVPFFVLENGRLSSIQKARSPRHMADMFYDFVTEFERLRHVAWIQGVTPFAQEVHTLRERIHVALRPTPLCEYPLDTPTAMILGPRCLGIIVMDCTGNSRR